MLSRYNRRELGKQQLKLQLRMVAGREVLRSALLEMIPDIDLIGNRRAACRQVDALVSAPGDVTVRISSARNGDLGILAACCKLGSVYGCRLLLQAGADPNADAALSRTLTLEGFAPHAHALPATASAQSLADVAYELTRVQLVQGQGQLECAELLLAAGARLDGVAGDDGGEADEQRRRRSVASPSSRAASAIARLAASTESWLSLGAAPASARSNVRARIGSIGASPLELAQRQWRDGGILAGSAAALCVVTHEGWSPRTHPLFPAAARARAAALARLGFLLSRQPRYATEAQAMVDVWLAHVMRHAMAWRMAEATSSSTFP